MLAALHAGTDGGTYFVQANQSVLAIAQIETVQSLDNLDDILSVPGLDFVYVGPADLSVSAGGPAEIDNVGDESVADSCASSAPAEARTLVAESTPR